MTTRTPIRTTPIPAVLVPGLCLLMAASAEAIDTSHFPIPLPEVKSSETAARPAKQMAVPDDAGRPGFAAKTANRFAGSVGRTQPASEQLIVGVERRLEAIRQAKLLGLDRNPAARHLGSTDAVFGFERLESSNPDLQIRWHEDTGVPRFISGTNLLPMTATPFAPEDAAAAFLRDQKALLRIDDPSAEFEQTEKIESEDGFQAVRLQQVHEGIPVWARDVVVRLDRSGRVSGFSGTHLPSASFPDATPAVSEGAAAQTARESMSDRYGTAAVSETPELMYFLPIAGNPEAESTQKEPRLAWRVRTRGNAHQVDDVFVDASTGAILHSSTRVCMTGPATGSGRDLAGVTRSLELWESNGTNFMVNTTKDMFDLNGSQMPDNPKGGILIANANHAENTQELFHVTSNNLNSWTGSENAVSSSFYAGQVYDYFKQRHSRTSIDGNGGAMILVVNFGTNFANAFWSAPIMHFGNGDGQDFSDLAGSLDVTAHEMSHGVTEHTANLVYEFQSGALNEHFSDAFGVATDFFANGNGANWLLGEEVTTPNIAGDCLRNMIDPGASNVAFGGQPRHMNEYRNLTIQQDNGGVHINSGIPNRAFYFATVDQGLGIEATEKIWYRALTQYLNRSSQFVDFRLATIQAAVDLYGAAAGNSVAAAMDAVGITDGEPTDPGGDLPDNTGADYLSFIDASTGNVIRVDLPNGSSFEQITGVSIAASGRPSFADDGSIFAWVAADQNIYVSASNGSGTQQLSDTGDWNSVAINAEGTILAATTVYADGMIYLFDLGTGNGQAVELQSQNSSDGDIPSNIVAADVMEFAAGGDYLIYDTLNRSEFGGTELEFWDINLLRLTDGTFFRVFPSLPAGESVGNPTLGQNHDNLMAFDYVDTEPNVYVLAVDFETGDVGQLTNNFDSLGRPTFAGDDGAVYYQYDDGSSQRQIWYVELEAGGLNGDPKTDTAVLNEALNPVFFTIGTRPTPILLSALEGDWFGDQVVLEWAVPDVASHVGFEVERVIESGSPELRTPDPISSRDGQDGRFQFVDEAPVAASRAEYRIIGVKSDGHTEELGRLELTPGRSGSIGESLALLPAYPNPFAGSVQLRFTVPSDTGLPTSVTIHDVQGRVVARPVAAEQLASGVHQVEWDGRTEDGRPASAGVFFVRLSQGGMEQTQRVTLLR